MDNRLVTVQQGTRHHEIVHVGRRRHHHVDQPGVRVDTDVRLHAEEPLVPLAGLVHLRVPRARPVLCRARGRDDRRIDQRAPADHQATRPEHRVDLLEQGHGQVVAPGEVAEAQDGRGVRDAGGAWVDARKRPLHRDIVQSLTGRLVGEREPLLQELDPQQHQDRVRWPAGGPRRGERDNPGDKGVPRDDGEHLLEEGLPARALGGSFETVRETQLVRATMIPGQAPAPLPFAVNP